MTERDALLMLNAVTTVSRQQKRKLLDHFGSAKRVFCLQEKDFDEAGFQAVRCYQKICGFPKKEFLEKEYQLMAHQGAQFITYNDDQYPALLKEIPDYPLVLYIKGKLDAFQQLSFAIVGSRRSSLYGCLMAERFSRELAQRGVTIVSGMAKGIDTAAHQGCLKVSGRTIAVLGSGLSHIYPKENKKLFHAISETGLVLSEFSMDSQPIAYHFPQRNQIISGLSIGVLVIEASKRSGALITSRFALDQGRDIFALPGNINTPNSYGTNDLIKKGAKLVNAVEDVLEEINPYFKQFVSSKKNVCHNSTQVVVSCKLSEYENSIVDLLSIERKFIDDIVRESSFSYSEIMKGLLSLEMKKIIQQLPGRYYKKVH